MGLADALLLEAYPINVYLARRSDGVQGSGSVNDPFDASTQARFDARMAQYQTAANVTIHLGPGTFETKDRPANFNNIRPRSSRKS